MRDIPEVRPQWGEPAAVVVPKPEFAQLVSASIDPGSAIVAFRHSASDDRLIVYYESNRLGASNLNTLQERALHAYGRMAKKYPTIAMSSMEANMFEVVGSIDPDRFEIDKTHPAVQAWVAHEPNLLDSSPSWPRMRR
jgi:hypothetical protein